MFYQTEYNRYAATTIKTAITVNRTSLFPRILLMSDIIWVTVTMRQLRKSTVYYSLYLRSLFVLC